MPQCNYLVIKTDFNLDLFGMDKFTSLHLQIYNYHFASLKNNKSFNGNIFLFIRFQPKLF